MEKNQVISNFRICSSQRIEELEAVLYVMEHEKSGARLIWLDRKEENKTFSIAFKTQPWDDTGVFHILEHSVLCGSEKYPVKEPFVELLKSSMNTFLNAMTFWDKTVYPVSSRNDQDFLNLMRVYMDAVLHPLIDAKPEIFYQEGWHYELGEEASYKGVVFNEMKGSFASPDTLSGYELARHLFPDTCYRFVSGGDPEHIPELTYESFVEAHRRLYHPSNSYIFLDGNLDIDQVLSILDGEFLAEYDRVPVPEDIPYQQPVDGGVSEITYELSSQEEITGRARLLDGFMACTFKDREELTALYALADVLSGDNQAPLKRCLLEAGLARNLVIEVNSGILQPYVSIEAKDVDEDKFDQVSDTLYGEIGRLAREGLDHRRILATLDNLEFQARERDYGRMPQGLGFNLQVLDSWLYGGDPAANLSVGNLYDELRQKCGEGYFESLLEKIFLDNPHHCRVLMRPSHTLGQERQAGETARLRAAQAQWDEAQTDLLRERQAKIEAWQSTPDTPEALAAIPVLRLDQIGAEPEELPLYVEEQSGIPVLRHPQPTGGITYLNLYFAIDDFTPEQLTKTAFLAMLLGSLETDAHGLDELQKEMRSLFGQVHFAVEAYSKPGELDRCRTFLCASCSMLDFKLEKALALLGEMLTGSHWNDEKRVYELLCQYRASFAEQIVMAGHNAALNRVLACTSAEGAVQEHTGGIEYLRWMKEVEKDFQHVFPALAEELTQLAKTIFCQRRLTLSVTGSGEKAAAISVDLLGQILPEGDWQAPAVPAVRPWGKRREGIVIPADVSFAVLGGPFKEAAQGQAKVVARAVSLAYLWNVVRVQGGAYGTGMLMRDTGFAGYYSFRDPSAARTLECYGDVGEFLKGAGEMDLTGMIIGAVAEADPLLTARMRGKVSDARCWRGITQQDLTSLRKAMLATKPEDLAALIPAVDALARDGSVCVLGSRRQLDSCADWLDTVSEL